MGGVEPPNAGVKVLCLASWRHRFMGKLSVLLNNSFASHCGRTVISIKLRRRYVDMTEWDCRNLSPNPYLLTCFALFLFCSMAGYLASFEPHRRVCSGSEGVCRGGGRFTSNFLSCVTHTTFLIFQKEFNREFTLLLTYMIISRWLRAWRRVLCRNSKCLPLSLLCRTARRP